MDQLNYGKYADLRKYLLYNVEMTGVKLGAGSFGRVEEVTMADTAAGLDLQWWQSFLGAWNFTSGQMPPGGFGCGAVMPHRHAWFQFPWPSSCPKDCRCS